LVIRFKCDHKRGINGNSRASTQLDVSATPAREAIKRLQAERALIAGANRAATVSIPSRSDELDLRDICMLLEGLATEKTVSFIKADDTSTLETYC